MSKNLVTLFLIFAASNAFSAKQKILQPVAVIINNAKGEQVGDLNLTQEDKGVRVIVNLTKLPPGTYAVHFHENGNCVAPEFKTAGDHFNPGKTPHGFETKGGPHAGDLRNIVVGSDGLGHLDELNMHVTLRDGDNSLLRKGGTAVVIHEKADDYKSQPAGASGKRIACGEIKTPDRTK